MSATPPPPSLSTPSLSPSTPTLSLAPSPHPRIPSLPLCLRLTLSHQSLNYIAPSPGWRSSSHAHPYIQPCSSGGLHPLSSVSALILYHYLWRFSGSSCVFFFPGSFFCQPSRSVQPLGREAPCWEWTRASSGVRCWSCCG